MLFKSTYYAKLLLGLSLVIGSTSIHFGKQWSVKAESLTGSYTKAEASAKKHEKSLAELTAELTPDALDIPLEKNVSNVMLDVLNSRLRHGITLDSSSPNKQGVGGFNKVQDLSEKVPNSSLYSLRVNLRGSYKTYAGLMNYLKELQVHPAAIVRLKVQEKSFEASIRIYGTK